MGLKVQCERSSQDFIAPNDARYNLRGDKIFNSQEEKMLMGADFDLNPMQSYADPLKEVLKQTMLNQEVIFRKQVHELHRLYRMQKTLMEDFGWKGFDGYNLRKGSTQSTLGPFTKPLRYEPLAEEKTFSTIPMVGSTQSLNKDYLEEHRGTYSRLQQGTLDLQLPADHYINCIDEDFLKKENGRDSLKESGELKHYHCGDNVSPPEEVKLSLSIGGDNGKKSCGKKTWYDKITKFSSQHVIDLEESTEKVSNEDAKPVSALGCAAPITYSGDKHDTQVSVQSNRSFTDSVKKDPYHGLAMSHSVVDGSESCQKQNSFNQGFKECHGDIPCSNMFTKGKPFTSYKAVRLDLNRVQLDDSSFYSNDLVLAHPSSTSSSGVFDGLVEKFQEGTCPTVTSWRKTDIIRFNETSVLLQQDDAENSPLMDSNSNNNGTHIWARSTTSKAISGSEMCPVDLESVSGLPSDLCEDLGSHSRNSENKNVHLQLKFPNGNYTDVTMAEVNGEKGEVDIVFLNPNRSQNTVQDGHSNKSAALCKFDCIADENSSSVKTGQSGTDLGESNLPPVNKFPKSVSSQVAETPSGERDPISSDSSELKHECLDKKKEGPAEVDVLIQKAAELLIHISLESPISNQDCFTKVGSNKIEDKERGQPQYSLDSYESIVLKLTESSVDDYCVTSKPFEIDEMDKKDCGIKLKRGRRLKDFQRDILPGLASLSRHEICEDINIMEGVIRSREYKKMRSKMADGVNWFAPVRSRRSRLNYVGRKYYS